jgi:hypothetical protein
MTKAPESLLTQPYVLIDDQLVPARHGRGRRPEPPDSESLCLSVAQMLPGYEDLLEGHAGWREASDRQSVTQTDTVQG